MDSENIAITTENVVSEEKPEAVEKTEAPELTVEQKEAKLAELIASGRRSLKLNDVDTACDVLSDAAELSSEIYGDGHEKTFESLLYYGMATLEQAKKDNQLLANQKADEEKEEAEEDDEQKDETEEKNSEDSEKEDGEESDAECDEENDSMKLAWELLETARCIATCKIDDLQQESGSVSEIEYWNLQNADILVLLGEHGIADGKYAQAQEDLENALQLQTAFLPPTSRLIAQTYMLIGNACGLDSRFEETVTFFKKSKEVLNGRLEELKSQLADESIDSVSKGELEAEVKELDEMMPGVDEMIADAVSSAAQAEEVKKSLKSQFAGITEVLANMTKTGEAAGEANDITSMIRRPAKRPTEETGESAETKKSKDAEASSSSQN